MSVVVAAVVVVVALAVVMVVVVAAVVVVVLLVVVVVVVVMVVVVMVVVVVAAAQRWPNRGTSSANIGVLARLAIHVSATVCHNTIIEHYLLSCNAKSYSDLWR